jgi:PAS domain S-box-containing protein
MVKSQRGEKSEASVEAFGSLLNALPANAAILDAGGVIVAVNQAWTDFGLENGNAGAGGVGENYLAVCARGAKEGDECAARAMAGLESLREGRQELFSLEYPCHSPGVRRWFRLLAKPINVNGGRGILTLHINITDRIIAVEKLRATEERQRLLLDANPIPSWVFDLETLGFLAVNDAAVRRYGYTKEEFRTLTLRDIRPPTDLPDFLRVVRTHSDGAYVGPSRHRLRSGEVIDVEIHSHPVHYEGRRASLVLAIDISDRKRISEQIRQQAALIDQAQEAIIVRDLNQRITFWSQGAVRLYEWTPADVLGRAFDELLDFPRPVLPRAMAAVLRHGSWSGEVTKTAKSGKRIIVQASWTLLRDVSGAPQAVMTFDRDVTQQKQLEEQLLRAQRVQSVGTLAGGIAHDFNNLLSPIIMAVGLLKARGLDEKEARVVDTIEQSALRGAQLVRQILSFARGVAGERGPIEVGRALAEIADIVENTFPKNVILRQEIADSLWPILGDPTQFEQVVLNLAVNARDAMPQGGTLTIRARNEHFHTEQLVRGGTIEPGRYVVLELSDTGHGMPPEVIDRIFEPFFTTKGAGKGTGLGLATVHGIVRSHLGFVDVQSEPGNGTSFQVYWPAAATAGEMAADSAAAVVPKGHGELILVVDDEAAIRETTRHILEFAGYRVALAENGAVGLSAIRSGERPALVLADWFMPGLDGREFAAALAASAPSAAVLIMTGGDTHELREAALLPMIAKPFTPEQLLQRVAGLLRAR